MLLPIKPKHRFLLYMAMVTCFTAQRCITSAESTSDQFSWSNDSGHSMSGVKDVIVDMENLSAMSTSILEFSENSTDYVSLRIETPSLENVESCTSQSNRLLLQIDSVNKSAPLICGNEVVEIHTIKFPFKLLFIKGSIGSKLQLNKFSIFVDRTTDYPHDKYSNLTISPYPRITYSPFYPDAASSDLSFTTTFNMAETVLFQLRKRRPDTYWGALTLGKEDGVTDIIRDKELVALVKNRFFPHEKYVIKFDPWDDDMYEFEYRSITRDYIDCNKITDYNVNKTTVLRMTISKIDNQFRCNVNFTAKPTQALVFTSVHDESCDDCDNFRFKMYVDDDQLPIREWDFPKFGVIRTPPGKNVRIHLTYSDFYVNGGSIQFLVEAYEADDLPMTVIAHKLPSYIWTAGSNESPRQNVFQIYSVMDRCTDFSALDQNMNRNENPLSDFVAMYSGSGQSGNFKLTDDCLGRPRNESVINKGLYEITTVVSASRSPFWFQISKLGKEDEPCVAPFTDLEITSTDTVYSLFPRVPIQRHMSCMFVLPAITSTTGNQTDIKYRGRLAPDMGAELFVKYSEYSFYKKYADFRHYAELSTWIVSTKTVYINFQTQSNVSADMATFEYRTRYSSTDTPQPTPACPGPLEVTFNHTRNYTFDTPEYPNQLDKYTSCKWRFKKPANNANRYIHVAIRDMPKGLCYETQRRLSINTSPEVDGYGEPRICGTEYYQVFPDGVDVNIDGSWGDPNPGIRLHVMYQALEYQELCDKIHFITKDNPGLDFDLTLEPGHYVLPFNCRISFNTRDSGVRLFITLPDESNGYNRIKKYIKMYDGPDNKSSTIYERRYTGGSEFYSSNNSVMIQMSIMGRSQHPENFKWFVRRTVSEEREWAGRKRVLYAAEDTEFLASLGYPQDYRKSSNGLVPYRTDWMWEISSLTGQQVEIEIVDLTLDGDTSCDYTAVRVFDGPGDQFPLLGKICGQIKKNLTFRSTNEVLFIHFVYTDLSQDLPTKFKIGYYTRSSPSPGVEIGKNRLYNGLNDDDDDSLGKTTITLIIVACVLAILLAVVVVVIWKVRQRITTRDAPIEADNKTRVPLRVTYTNNKSSVNGV